MGNIKKKILKYMTSDLTLSVYFNEYFFCFSFQFTYFSFDCYNIFRGVFMQSVNNKNWQFMLLIVF